MSTRFKVLSLSMLLFGAEILCSPSTVRADAIGPEVVLLGNFAANGVNFKEIKNGAPISTCIGSPIQFRVSAFDPDGLGTPFFGSTAIYFWDFGTGTVGNPLAAFSNRPEVNFTGPTTLSVAVADRLGNLTRITFNVSIKSCP